MKISLGNDLIDDYESAGVDEIVVVLDKKIKSFEKSTCVVRPTSEQIIQAHHD